MKRQYKVSVIIPVYKVSKYIEKCSRSLFEQTLDDIEYLFVDDCSPDDSIDILKNVIDLYPERNGDVIIHRMQSNSGQAKVREWGMRNASGEYVIHCDSDDWIEDTMYETMYKLAKINDSDIVFCDYKQYFSDTQFVTINRGLKYSEERDTILKYLLQAEHHLNYLWAALVKRETYINKITYPVYNQGEDWSILVQIVLNSNRIDYINRTFYNYWCNQNSITRSKSKQDIIDRVTGAVSNRKMVYSIISNAGLDHQFSEYIIASKYQCKLMLLKLSKKQGVRKLWYSTFPEVDRGLLLNRQINLKKKIFAILIFFNIWKP